MCRRPSIAATGVDPGVGLCVGLGVGEGEAAGAGRHAATRLTPSTMAAVKPMENTRPTAAPIWVASPAKQADM